MGKLASLLIKGGRVIDPAQKIDKKANILFIDGRVADIGKKDKADKIIDASGSIVIPGMIDLHVHLRQPGREDEETVASAQKAAIAGGITSVCSMPNTEPVADKDTVIEFILKEARFGLADVHPVGAITKGLKGQELAEMESMAKAGAIAFSDDGNCIMDSSVMFKACQYANSVGLPLIVHAEDKNLTEGSQMNESLVSLELGLPGSPNIAEEFIVARDIMISAYTGAKVHFAHISTAGSVALIRRAKEDDLNITSEVTPHHLLLDDGELESYDSNYKVNPPLRTEEDKDTLIKGLIDGTIDAIATDHAPHSLEEKEKEFAYTPSGIIGLETAVGLVFGKLVAEGKLSLEQAVTKLTSAPASIMGLNKGTLEKGKGTDAVVLDLSKVRTIEPSSFYSKSRNTPFGGWKVKASVKAVIKDGKLVYKDGEFIEA